MNVIQNFKNELEVVLDEGFPKVEEEGPEKVAMKRGPALALFGTAVVLAHGIVKAFGGCEKCFGKGYSTEQVGHADSVTDFGTLERHVVKGPHQRMNFCSCERGKQLKALIKE